MEENEFKILTHQAIDLRKIKLLLLVEYMINGVKCKRQLWVAVMAMRAGML